ncbi:MAG TPA: hypothetical protein VHQ90_06575 [Thermoanaerobaculia bacterium]|nr:hypothetical protein [Thermoanaerobaculia bacterium]
MADEPKAKPRKKRAPAGTRAKPLSLYPMTLEEAVKKLARVKPEPPRTKSHQKKGATDKLT